MFGIGAGRKKTVGARGEPMPENHDGPPDTSHPSGLCPRCEKQSSFQVLGSIPLTFDGGRILGRGEQDTPTFQDQSTVLLCNNCGQGVAVLEEMWIGDQRRSEGVRSGGVVSWKGFHWWPLLGSKLHNAVPASIAEAFNEAALALSANCPRAAAVMARRTLEAIAEDQGQASGTLADKLKAMANKGLLHPTLAEWAKEVRLVGNAGAHYDPINVVSADDARQLVEFIRELSKFIYELPYELNARRASKP